MLSKKKIKIMFLMASYEKGIGKKDLKIIRYYKNDYIRMNILTSVVCSTIAYLLILALLAMYNMDYFIKNAVSIDYASFGIMALCGYVILIGLYIFVTMLVCSVRYDQARKRVRKYFKYLKYLGKYYQENVDEEDENYDA